MSDLSLNLFDPMSVTDFAEKYWQRQPCHITGNASKFSSFFGWEDLNSILESFHFEYPRLRMSKFGIDVAPKEYLEKVPFTQDSRVNVEGLHRHFAEGASLILQHVDEFSPRLKAISDALQRTLGWYSEVEVIAGCGTSNSLSVHFDGSECFALQLVGSKKWSFYEPTRLYPLRSVKVFPARRDVSPALPPAVHSPLMTFDVHPGDLVYVPRGWWHFVEPQPGPCLSLNPTVYSPTVQDFLQWLAQELSAYPIFRQPIPSQACAQQKLVSALTEALTKQISAKMLSNYIVYLHGETETPISLELPFTRYVPGKLNADCSIRIANGIPLYAALEDDSSHFRVRCNGKELRFDRSFYALFSELNDGSLHSIRDLIASADEKHEDEGCVKFLESLIAKHLLDISSPPQSPRLQGRAESA